VKNFLENKRKIYFFFTKFHHLLFSEKFKGKINFNFDTSKSRFDLINDSIIKNKYSSYLEIGCDQDQIFQKIKIKDKVGVDPVSGGNFRGTSDEFFNQNIQTFDCIFIDGLHEYNQVKKDIINSLKFLNNNGVIFLHDCLPDTISKQYVPRCRYSWNGDVWKAIVEMRTRKDLDTCTSLIDQGVAIIKKRQNQDLLKNSIENFKALTFQYFYENYTKVMRLKNYKESVNFF